MALIMRSVKCSTVYVRIESDVVHIEYRVHSPPLLYRT